MSKIRILEIVGEPVGGIRKHVHDILNELYCEFDFYYISSGFGDLVYSQEIDSVKKNICNHYTLSIKKKPSFSDVIYVIKIINYIRRNNIQVVHGHGAKGGLYARICGKLTGCKVMYTPHGGVVHSMFGKFEDILYKLIERSLCRFTDLLIFESNYTARSFDDRFCCPNVNKVVNYNGVRAPVGLTQQQALESKTCSIKDTYKIGVFGLIREQKGQHLALDVVTSLLNREFSIELHFFGEGPMRLVLENTVKERFLEKKVFFHGEVSNCFYHMNKMDFILIPSLFESFGYVAVESMLAKVPVISSSAGGLSEVVTDQIAFIFSAGNSQSMENALSDALLCPKDRLNDMVNDALETAENKFSIERMTSVLSRCYTANIEKNDCI